MTPRERADALIKAGKITERGRDRKLMVVGAVCFTSGEDSLRYVQEQVAGAIREAVSEERARCAKLVAAAYAALHALESSEGLEVADGAASFEPFPLTHGPAIGQLRKALEPYPQPCRCGVKLTTDEQRTVGQCPTCERDAIDSTEVELE